MKLRRQRGKITLKSNISNVCGELEHSICGTQYKKSKRDKQFFDKLHVSFSNWQRVSEEENNDKVRVIKK